MNGKDPSMTLILSLILLQVDINNSSCVGGWQVFIRILRFGRVVVGDDIVKLCLKTNIRVFLRFVFLGVKIFVL